MDLASIKELAGKYNTKTTRVFSAVTAVVVGAATLLGGASTVDSFVRSWTGAGEAHLQISGMSVQPATFYKRYLWRRGLAELPYQFGIAFNVRKAYGVALKGCALQVAHPTLNEDALNTHFRTNYSFDVASNAESVREMSLLPEGFSTGDLAKYGATVMLVCDGAVTDPIPFPHT